MNFRLWNCNCAFYYYYLINMSNIFRKNRQFTSFIAKRVATAKQIFRIRIYIRNLFNINFNIDSFQIHITIDLIKLSFRSALDNAI
jgi:hypothetical protein